MSDASTDISRRMALYREAEEPVRGFFASHFGGLCGVCGAVAGATSQHLCCCAGVRCIDHLDRSPVLLAMLESSPANAELVCAHRSRAEPSLLGPAGCLLDWGRPPPCNVCICTPQRRCLCAVMPAADVVAFNRSLRAYYTIADPGLRSLVSCRRAVDELKRCTNRADTAIRANGDRFRQALQTQRENLLAYCDQFGVPRPTMGY